MRLFWLVLIIPLSMLTGAICMALVALNKCNDIPPICEDCPRVDIADPIGAKYGTEDE